MTEEYVTYCLIIVDMFFFNRWVYLKKIVFAKKTQNSRLIINVLQITKMRFRLFQVNSVSVPQANCRPRQCQRGEGHQAGKPPPFPHEG